MEQRKTRPGEEPRAPLEQAIGLRFKQLGDFIDELAANVSTGGMFIRTRKPHPVGSVFEFEFRLGNDRPLIAGKAQVAWVRRRSQYLDKPVGMGVRFVELDDESRRHIAELVAAQEEKGGPPVEIDPPDEAPNPAPVEQTAESAPSEPTPPKNVERAAPAATTPPLGGATAETEESRPSRLPWILLTIVLALALAATFWRRPALEEPPSEAALAPIEQASAGSPSASPAPQAEPAQLRAVNEWARAWSEQRVDDYLEAYSPNFNATAGLDRVTWERQRRARILAPQWIRVDLAFVELEETGTDSGRVRFVQAYQSDSYSDVVRKVLDVERQGERWKIVRETVEP